MKSRFLMILSMEQPGKNQAVSEKWWQRGVWRWFSPLEGFYSSSMGVCLCTGSGLMSHFMEISPENITINLFRVGRLACDGQSGSWFRGPMSFAKWLAWNCWWIIISPTQNCCQSHMFKRPKSGMSAHAPDIKYQFLGPQFMSGFVWCDLILGGRDCASVKNHPWWLGFWSG